MPEALLKCEQMVDGIYEISTFAERQAENKRKLDNNHQAQQQLPKRQNVVQAYAAVTGERKEYAGTLPLCNKLNLGKKQREPTFQVVLDALALTPCYSAFLITADVPEVYMHQFWDTIHKYENSYRFRMDKKSNPTSIWKCLEIFQICPRVHGQNFDALPTDEDIVSFFKEMGHTREIKSITDVVVD
ncbi:hypothetical protein Tco_0299085 [Tanacetum coccineum]